VCPRSFSCDIRISAPVAIVQTAISARFLPLRRRIVRITGVIIGKIVAHAGLLVLRSRKHIAEASSRRVGDRGRGFRLDRQLSQGPCSSRTRLHGL